MLNNYLVDSELLFPKHTWVIDNASVTGTQKLKLKANKGKETFGLHQTIWLREKGRYYFRVEASAIKYVKEIIIGVEVDGSLKATKHFVGVNVSDVLSVIVDIKEPDKAITLYVICVNKVGDSEISISKPVLYRLDEIWLRFSLKPVLDRKLEYFKSFSYDNILPTAEMQGQHIEMINGNNAVAEPVETGSIAVTAKSSINLKIKTNYQASHIYLVKILKEEVNFQGKTILCYRDEELGKGVSRTQQYMIFTYDGAHKPYIKVERKEGSILPYRVILKRVMVIDLNDFGQKKLTDEEIKRLIFVE